MENVSPKPIGFRLLCKVARNSLKKLMDRKFKTESKAQEKLVKSLNDRLESIIAPVDLESPEPEVLFKKSLQALEHIDQERFLIENLLESIKREDNGRTLRKTLQRYSACGLIDIDFDDSEDDDQSGEDPDDDTRSDGSLLIRLLRRLKGVAFWLIKLAYNALRLIPKFVGVKPIIGVTGVFPSLSFQIEAEAQAVDIYEIWEILTQNL